VELEQGVSDMLSRKLRLLNDFLLSEEVGDDTMLLSELDGFLAGVIVCPEMIMPSEWMPVVWGDDEGPVFDDVKQAQAISDLILGHYNDIIRQLDQGRYRPIFDLDTDETILWEIWIEGFVEAMRLRPEAWLAWAHDNDADLQRAWFVLGRLGELTTNPNDIEPLDIDEELEDLAPDLIPSHVEILHKARLTKASINRPEPSTFAVKIGRNDPCPCGSGKKFKKCCLN
jgi:uncharacterized protein